MEVAEVLDGREWKEKKFRLHNANTMIRCDCYLIKVICIG